MSRVVGSGLREASLVIRAHTSLESTGPGASCAWSVRACVLESVLESSSCKRVPVALLDLNILSSMKTFYPLYRPDAGAGLQKVPVVVCSPRT